MACKLYILLRGDSQPVARERSSVSIRNALPVGHSGGITQHAGGVISFGIIGISEIPRSLP
jgi:hypothetical protein